MNRERKLLNGDFRHPFCEDTYLLTNVLRSKMGSSIHCSWSLPKVTHGSNISQDKCGRLPAQSSRAIQHKPRWGIIPNILR